MNPIAQAMFAKHTADAQTQIKLGVGVAVFDAQGRLLLEKRSDCGLWGLLGGRVEPGESLTQAAIREVKEESGLDILVGDLVGVYSIPDERIMIYLDNGDVRHLVDVVLYAQIAGGQLTISSESQALEFFDLTALPAEIMPPARIPLEDVLHNRTGMLR